MRVHVALDQAREAARGDSKIGTTGRGIGPTYEDKVSRRGLRVADAMDPARFSEKVRELMEYHNFILTNLYQAEPVDVEAMIEETLDAVNYFKPAVCDTVDLVHRSRRDGKIMLFEGAQGSLLDIDHGTYPFVTSSNTTAGGVATGSGLGPRYIDAISELPKPMQRASVQGRCQLNYLTLWGSIWPFRVKKWAPRRVEVVAVDGSMRWRFGMPLK